MRAFENAFVGQKAHERAALFGGHARVDQMIFGYAALHFAVDFFRLEFHAEDLAVFIHFHREPFAERVCYRRAHAVQAAAVGIVFVVELAARVQLGENHFHARHAERRVHVYGNAASVIFHAHAAVGI